MRLLKTLCLAFCLLAFAACGGGGGGGGATPPVTDTILPSVAITAPATGSTVQGIVAITATSSDDVGVSRVEFYQDRALLGSDGTAPYSFNWNTQGVVRGNHTITAKAYDAAGNVQQSAEIVVVVPLLVRIDTEIVGSTAVGTIFLSGVSGPEAYGIEAQVTKPAVATITSVINSGVAVGALPPSETNGYLAFGSSDGFGSGEVMKVNFANVPIDARREDFAISLFIVFDGGGNAIQ